MSSYKTLPTPGDTAWFTHDRFGMFIHFGLYAMPARHEWVKNYEEIPEDHYDLYFKHFNPDLYDPKEWARQAKAAGMKYVVMTTNITRASAFLTANIPITSPPTPSAAKT